MNRSLHLIWLFVLPLLLLGNDAPMRGLSDKQPSLRTSTVHKFWAVPVSGDTEESVEFVFDEEETEDDLSPDVLSQSNWVGVGRLIFGKHSFAYHSPLSATVKLFILHCALQIDC